MKLNFEVKVLTGHASEELGMETTLGGEDEGAVVLYEPKGGALGPPDGSF